MVMTMVGVMSTVECGDDVGRCNEDGGVVMTVVGVMSTVVCGVTV